MNLIRDLIDQSQATSFRTTCPYCGSYNSLSVNKVDGEYKYKCFDANCKTYGSYYTGYTDEEIQQKLYKPVGNKPYMLPQYFVKGIANDLCYEYLRDTFCLGAVQAGRAKVAYDPKEQRLVFLIYEGNTLRGAVGRAFRRSTIKSRIYTGSEPYPFICPSGRTLVIVEDCASACAVTRLPEYSGMALLGTSLKETYIPVIAKYEQVIIALDNDANLKALAMDKLLKLYTNSRVHLIPKDIKNMTDDELWENLSSDQRSG